MYEIPAEDDLLYQGDIFRGSFVFPFVQDPSEEVHILREQQLVPAIEVADAWERGSETILLPAFRAQFAIVLSNTCEISGQKDPLELVTLGGIFPLERLPNHDTRRNCKRRKTYRYHYLQAHNEAGLAESYVHFGVTGLIDRDALSNYRRTRVLTLPSPHREDLGHRFAEFLARVAIP
jgi:hypothetical protein